MGFCYPHNIVIFHIFSCQLYIQFLGSYHALVRSSFVSLLIFVLTIHTGRAVFCTKENEIESKLWTVLNQNRNPQRLNLRTPFLEFLIVNNLQ